MHGTGQFSALITMALGGAVVSLPDRKLRRRRAVRERRATARRRTSSSSARRSPARCSSARRQPRHATTCRRVMLISSSGVMWSHENKERPARHMPQAMLFDSFGSSRGRRAGRLGVGAGRRRADREVRARREQRRVHRRRPPRRAGLAARRAWSPSAASSRVGYYKDEAKSAQTFRTFEGRRWSDPRRLGHGQRRRHAPPARARVGVHQHRRREGLPRGGRGGAEDAPGRARRGRASACPTSASARRSARVVEPAEGDATSTRRAVIDPREDLSSPPYKAPRNVVVVDTIGRGRQRQGRLQAV